MQDPRATTSATAAPPWQQFICHVCGLIYDEKEGDADSGLAAGTRFADIPEDWACPICGVGKADFEPWSPAQAEAARAAAVRQRPATPGRLAGGSAGVPGVRGTGGQTARAGARQTAGVVVIGAGRAGWQVVQALREHCPTQPVTLVSACAGDVYDKPLISVALARGLQPAAMVRESAANAAARLGVRLLVHTHAVGVDVARQRVRTTRGTLRYSHLVLAQGAEPAVPAVLPPQWVWRINDLAAYTRLRAALRTQGSAQTAAAGSGSGLASGPGPETRSSPGSSSPQIAIIGAGLVGCELANDLALAGHAVTLIDTQQRPLAAQLPPLASQRLLQAWQGLPLHFMGGVQIASLQPVALGPAADAALGAPSTTSGNVAAGGSTAAAASGLRLTLTDGTERVFDHVIAATGLRASSRLARSAGLVFDDAAGGIVVQGCTGATSQPQVYALGDCVVVDGLASRYIEPIVQQARGIALAIAQNTAPSHAQDSAQVSTQGSTQDSTQGTGKHLAQTPPAARAPTLRIKTSSLPFTLSGTLAGSGQWRTLEDQPQALQMQRCGPQGDVLATLRAQRQTPRAGAY